MEYIAQNPFTVALGLTVGAVGVWFVYQSTQPGGGSSSKSVTRRGGSSSTALSQETAKTFKKFKLIGKSDVSHNVRRFRFSTGNDSIPLGLPIGKHIIIRIPGFKDDEGDPVERPYTPVSSDRDKGFFELVIKIYPDGQLTPKLDELRIGDEIEGRGPEGRIRYVSPGKFELIRPLKSEMERLKMTSKPGYSENNRAILMIAGGTGITPMLQIIDQVYNDPDDHTECFLIFANRSIDDILCREELESLNEKSKQIHVFFTLDKGPADTGHDGMEWNGNIGFVTQKLVEQCFPRASDDVILLECGPPIMMKFLNKFLKPMGYKYITY